MADMLHAAEIVAASVASSGDKKKIAGVTDTILFSYDVATRDVRAYSYVAEPPLGPRTISADLPTGDEGEGTLGSDLPGAPADPSERAGRGELAGALARAMDALGAEHREVFVLAQVEGLKYEEIAELLRIPVGTVKSRMHVAVRLLRESLGREGIEP